MQKNYKLIAFDIDGTILDERGQVCERLKDVVSYLKMQGYLFTLVSARLPLSVIDIAEELGLEDDLVALNGSLITNFRKEIMYSNTFTINRVEDALTKVSHELSLCFYHEFNWWVENPSKYTDLEAKYIGHNYQINNTIRPTHLNKVCVIGEHALLVGAAKVLKQLQNMNVEFSHTNYLELTCSSISKLNALVHYAKARGFTPSQILAFGDGENDIPMLSGVGHGVAMHNALQHVKDSAHAITPHSHIDQGVARYLEHLISSGVL
jgi:hypothetical protein